MSLYPGHAVIKPGTLNGFNCSAHSNQLPYCSTLLSYEPLKLSRSSMFNAFQNPAPPNDTELASQTLTEESSYRFASFTANDAVTLGLSIRKRFRASSRHARGKGLVISIQTVAGHTLFSCTVGDLGHPSGIADVSLDSWACLEVRVCA